VEVDVFEIIYCSVVVLTVIGGLYGIYAVGWSNSRVICFIILALLLPYTIIVGTCCAVAYGTYWLITTALEKLRDAGVKRRKERKDNELIL